MSFWERYKHSIYKYGHIYATFFGLVVVNYIPQAPTNTLMHRLAVLYSHLVAALLIVVLPVYFGCNITTLITTSDQRWKLLLWVSFTNTLIKYLTVVVTYVANQAYYSAIREITRTRQQLEDGDLGRHPEKHDECARAQFESMLLFKFALINIMMVLQSAHVLQLWWMGAHTVRVHLVLYAFLLWNYTENMADYFYFINSSALKFFRQWHMQLLVLVRQLEMLSNEGKVRGMRMQMCCTLSDDLDDLAVVFKKIHRLYFGSIKLQQFQILGLVLTALISNTANSFSLFHMFFNYSKVAAFAPAMVLNTLHALAYLVDTYIVALVSENINNELRGIAFTVQQMSGVAALDERLEQSIEQFSLLLINTKAGFCICGLFDLDRRLTFVTAATVLSYLVTLVQFDLSLT